MTSSKDTHEFETATIPLVAQFSDAENNLKDVIAEAPNEIIANLLSVFQDRWFRDVLTDRWLRVVYTPCQGNLKRKDREVAAVLMIHELRQYAGNTLNIFSDKPHYEQILTKVHKQISKRNKKNVPEIASVSFRENSIASMLLEEALKSLTLEELKSAIKGSALDPTKEQSRKILIETVAGSGITGLYEILGKKAIKKFVLEILEKYAVKLIGEKAAKIIVEKIALKLPQKLFKSLLGFLGWALLAKDMYDIAGEASRVTVPFVVNVAIYRTLLSAGKKSKTTDDDDDETMAA